MADSQSVINTVLTISAALVTVFCLLKPGDKTQKPVKRLWLWFGLIMLGAFVIRAWKFGQVPGGFNQDGAMGAVDALALSMHGTDRLGMRMPAHLTAWGYGQMSAMLSYLTVPFIKVMGLSPFTARLPMLISSMFGLWALYSLIKNMLGEKPALVVLLFAAINPWHIMQSRWALDCNLFPHFLLFGICFLQKAGRKPLYAYISMLFFALSMYCYGIAFYLVPLFLAAACIFYLKDKILSLAQAGLCLAVFLLFACPILGVIIINFFKLPTLSLPFVTLPYFENSVRMNDLLFYSNEPLEQLLSNARSLIDVVFLQKPDFPWNSIPDFGVMYLFSMPLALLGFVRLLKKPEARLIILCFGAGVLAGLLTNNVNVNRINVIFYPVLIFIGYSLYDVYLTLKLKWRTAAALVTGIVYLGSFGMFASSYFGEHNDRLSEYFYDGFGQALEYADSLEEYGQVFITEFTQYQGSRHVSEILTQFHLELDSSLIQNMNEFKGRYRFVSFNRYPPDPSELNVVYVVNNKELYLFPGEEFEFIDFVWYSVVKPV